MNAETRTGFVYSADYLKHNAGQGHVEKPERLTAIANAVRDSGFWKSLVHLDPLPATLEQVEYFHDRDYVRDLRKLCVDGGGFLDYETGASPDSFNVALLAAGGVMRAVDAVMHGEVQNAFAAVRPPGHHAFPSKGKGFCLFNNVGIAARYLQEEHYLEKILIVDWDIHHGDGTHYFFYDDPSVLYFSIHQYPHYPGTGMASETGSGKGVGYTLNVPVFSGDGIQEYMDAFQQELKPAALAFRPDFVLISAGFDGHKDDLLSGTELASSAYGQFTDVVREVADQACGGRIVSSLEGGYNLRALAESVLEHLRHLNS